jgi:EmrB/QacA subfamily drug resistance transporter
MFMSVLDTSIVNVAIPTIQNEFGGTTDQVQWVVTGYTLMLGVVVPTTAWLGDRFGLTRVYNLALLAFAAGSALCGLSWDLNSLIVFRIIQAIPGGILPVITMSILLQIVPRDRLGAAMGLYGLGIVGAPAIGPTLGGYLVEYVNWRLIFYINVPIGILGALAAVLVLQPLPRMAGRRSDVLGFLTVAGGLFALLLATSEGETWGWGSYRILGLFTVSALSLALFVVIELEIADPLLDIRIFRYWAYTHSLLLIAVLMVVMFAVLFYIPLFLQQAQRLGAFDSGLTLLPEALVMGTLMPIAGRVYDRIGPRWPATIGLSIVAYGVYLLHTLTLDTPREHVMWVLVVIGTGLGSSMMPIFTGGLAVIPVRRSNAASACNNVVQRVSGALGVAVLTAIWTTQQAQQLAGRTALLPANTLTPHIGAAAVPNWVGAYALYQQTQLQVFVTSLDDLFLIAAALAALGALAAFFLRSGSTPPTRAHNAPQTTTPSPTANVGRVKHHAVDRDSVTSTVTGNASPTRQPRQPRRAALAEQIVAVSTEDPPTRATETSDEETLPDTKTAQQTGDQTTGEPDEPTTPTVELHHEELNISQTQAATVQANWDRISEQLTPPRPLQATDPATALAAEHEQVEQQRQRAEAADQQASPIDDHIEHQHAQAVKHRTQLTTAQPTISPATVEIAGDHREQQRPGQKKRAHGRTDDQESRLGPRQVELARQMVDEFDKHGKRRYTMQQIADMFGVTPSGLGVGLQCSSRRSATIASGKRIPAKKG